jgi:hypothetical protein
MPVPTALRFLSAVALAAASAVATAQSTPVRPDATPVTQDTATPAADPATATVRIDVEDDVTLTTRVVDPALVRASRAFDAMDVDGDGTLDAAETAHAPALSADFVSIDADGNGRIDRDEYTARLRR